MIPHKRIDDRHKRDKKDDPHDPEQAAAKQCCKQRIDGRQE